MLALREVYAGYGAGDVLRGVGFEVARGEVVCLIGPNGAGKSTVLATVSGLLRPRSGAVVFDGAPIDRLSPRARLRLGIVHVPQDRGLFPGLTVRQNLLLGAYLLRDRGEIRRRAERAAELFPIVERRAREPAGSLSGVEQRQVELARSLMAEPRLILLDEPSIGLEPRSRRLVFDSIQTLAAGGRTVLVVEQNARSGLAVADRGMVLHGGTVALVGPARALLDDPEVARLYLGGKR